MYELPTMACLLLAGLFAVIGLIQLAGPRFLREAYARWEYSQAVRVITGLLDLVAAAMLADPELRVWGIVLGAVLTFGAVVTLLNHRHYTAAGAAILMMVAFVPAALAVPRANEVRFITPATPVLAATH
jgi:hypothetical protein